MAKCDQLFWICQVDPLPPISLATGFLIFDLLVLLVLYLFYHNSVFQTIYLTEVEGSQVSKIDSFMHKFFTSIKLNFLGLAFISLNLIIAHVSIIFFRSYSGYYMVGFFAIPAFIGVVLILVGLILLQKFYVRNQVKGKTYVFYVVLLTLVFISVLILGSTWRIAQGDTLFRQQLVDALVILTIMIIIYNTAYTVVEVKYDNPVAEVQKLLVITLYLITAIGIYTSSFFVPSPAEPVDQHPTKTNQIELLLFIYNLYIILMAYILYLIVVMPKWFRKLFGITTTDVTKYYYDFLGITSPAQVVLNADTDVENRNMGATTDNLQEGFLIFTNLPKSYYSDIINSLDSQTDLLEILSTDALKDQFYTSEIRGNSNDIYLLTEINDTAYSVVDRIYNKYECDIDIDGDVLFYDRHMFRDDNSEFAIVFSHIDPKRGNQRLYFIVFPEKITTQVLDFLTNYFNYLEDLTYQGWYSMLLIFNHDQNGGIHPIPPDTSNPEYPDPSHTRILEQ